MKFRHKSLITAAAFFLAGSFFFSGVTAYGAAARTETEPAYSDEYFGVTGSDIVMEVSCGYDGAAKSGRYVPVNIRLSSQADDLFEGTVRVLAMESDYDIYQYDYPVSLKAGQEAEKSMEIPVGRADVLYVKLLDSQGRELVRKRLKMNVSLDVAELFVGVLSDEPAELSYMNGVGVNYSSVRIKTFPLQTESIPDHIIGLDLLDVLLITDYDSRKLKDDQISAVWEWVRGGGILLLGTGARADDTLAAFQSVILEDSYEPPAEKSVDMGVEYATNGPGDSFMNLVCADVSLKGGTGVLSNDEFPVLTSVSKGKGMVGVAAYDFVDIAAFCEVHRSYVDKLFTSLLGETKLNDLSSYLYSGNSSQYWSVQNMLNTGNVDKLPSLPFYIIVISGYILLAGPVMYLLLKKQERRRFYRSAVVCLSLFFTVLVYLMGTRTRFKDTFFTYASILDTSEDYVDEYTYINMRTPYNKPYTISLDPSYYVLPITRSNSYEMSPVPRFTGTEDYKVRISREEKETRISVQNVAAFTPKYYSLKKKTLNADHKGLLGDITLFEDQISGTVTNQYPFPVERVGILMYGKMVVIDSLKPGETVDLKGLPVIHYPINNSYLVSGRVTGSYLYSKADIEDPAYMLALSRTNILNFYLEKYSQAYNPEARIVAFSREQTDSQFVAKGSYETYGMAMFTSTLDVNMKQGDLISRSALMKSPAVINGQYYADSNAAYGVDPVTLEYSLGNDLDVQKLTFETPSKEFLNSESFAYTTMFKGNIYFYNHDTGNYDVMDSGKTVYKGWELEPYLSPGNTLTVKYVSDNTTDNNWYVTLPVLTVVGRDKE